MLKLLSVLKSFVSSFGERQVYASLTLLVIIVGTLAFGPGHREAALQSRIPVRGDKVSQQAAGSATPQSPARTVEPSVATSDSTPTPTPTSPQVARQDTLGTSATSKPSCGMECPVGDKAPSPSGVLVLDKYEFTVPKGGKLRDAFTARSASGLPIGMVSNSWKATPDTVGVEYVYDDPSTARNTSNSYANWVMSLSSFGAVGDYSFKVQASDGETIYYATIMVHVLPN